MLEAPLGPATTAGMQATTLTPVVTPPPTTSLVPAGSIEAPASGPACAEPPASSASAQCRFLDVFPAEGAFPWNCPHPVLRDGLCVFHLDKPPVADRGKLSLAEWEAAKALDEACMRDLQELIGKVESDPQAKMHCLVGFKIPLQFVLFQKHITKPLNFRRARFDAGVAMLYSTIQSADFSEATISGGFDLSELVFGAGTSFLRTQFLGPARFQSVEFKGRAIFSKARFAQSCSFSADRPFFTEFCNFREVTFEGPAEFVGQSGEKLFHDVTDFQAIHLVGAGTLSFTNLSLANANFHDTDLQKPRFVGVSWNEVNRRPSLAGDVALASNRPFHDVSRLTREAQLAGLAENYGQLVLNYEGRRDVDNAEAFHIGEMEMRRQRLGLAISQPWLRALRRAFSGIGVYRMSSRYGTSYGRAGAVLAGLLLVATLLFMWTGLTPLSSEAAGRSVPGTAASMTPIRYRLWPDDAHPLVRPREWLGDYSKSLVYVLSGATFQKERYYQPDGRASQLLAILSTLAVGSQSALLLLAIRRRFKR